MNDAYDRGVNVTLRRIAQAKKGRIWAVYRCTIKNIGVRARVDVFELLKQTSGETVAVSIDAGSTSL